MLPVAKLTDRDVRPPGLVLSVVAGLEGVSSTPWLPMYSLKAKTNAQRARDQRRLLVPPQLVPYGTQEPSRRRQATP
jgi:hypothetical protein